MNKSMIKKNILLKIMNYSIINLPAPCNLNMWWNMGSMTGVTLTIQLISGLIMSMHYSPSVSTAFSSVDHIMRDINYGWLMRVTHSNGASLFFICMYTHILRGIYYSSFKLTSTWNVGVMLMFTSMGTAFLGYVLPWGQMSFWGATVITNLLSAIPYMGHNLVNWIWGGFAVQNSTLNRFFSLHFILPFIIMAMVIIHLMFLHTTGSSNPIGLNSNIDKIPFNPYYSIKDLVGFSTMLMMLMMLNFNSPFYLSDTENFIPANPMITPIHIQPEWYFLFAYAILRSIPNKLGGVSAMMLSMMMLLLIPNLFKMKFTGMEFYPPSQILFWMMINNIILLTWIGAQPIEPPFVSLGITSTIMYFSYFILNPLTMYFWDKTIN